MSVVSQHGGGEVVKQTAPPKHADSFAPAYRRVRSLRLRAGGRPRRATDAVQPLSGTRRPALLGPFPRAAPLGAIPPCLKPFLEKMPVVRQRLGQSLPLHDLHRAAVRE